MDFCGSCGVPLRLGDAEDQCTMCKEEWEYAHLTPINVYAGGYDEITSLETWQHAAVGIANEVAKGEVESRDDCDSHGNENGMVIFVEESEADTVIEALRGNELNAYRVGEEE